MAGDLEATESEWPYCLPIWRRAHRAVSPDGKYVAEINPAYEVSMGNPTSGIFCLSAGLHLLRCNPSFLWSEDSRYVAVPQFFTRIGLFQRQRLLVIDVHTREIFASHERAFYFQPERFGPNHLEVIVNPFRRPTRRIFSIPSDLPRLFIRSAGRWSEPAA